MVSNWGWDPDCNSIAMGRNGTAPGRRGDEFLLLGDRIFYTLVGLLNTVVNTYLFQFLFRWKKLTLLKVSAQIFPQVHVVKVHDFHISHCKDM